MYRCIATFTAALLLAVTVPAVAVEVVTIPSSSAGELPVHDNARFNWSGFYAGIYGAGRVDATGSAAGLGIQAGVNAQFDFTLVGAEVSVQGLAGDAGNSAYGELLGRAGLVVTDDVVVYAAGGYGIDLGVPDEGDLLLGGGLELAVTDTVSVEAQYLQGLALDGSDTTHEISLGANFHF